jgi:glutaredoxin-like protein NrdH
MPDHDVHVYSRPNCMPCKRTKQLLDKAGVGYVEYDVDASPEAAETVRALGYSSVPVVTVTLPDGIDHWSGYRLDHINALTYLAGSDQ